MHTLRTALHAFAGTKGGYSDYPGLLGTKTGDPGTVSQVATDILRECESDRDLASPYRERFHGTACARGGGYSSAPTDPLGETLSRALEPGQTESHVRHRTVSYTATLGGMFYASACEHEEIAYNSCRNRHCPKCQASAASAARSPAGRSIAGEYVHVVVHLACTDPAAIAYYIKRSSMACCLSRRRDTTARLPLTPKTSGRTDRGYPGASIPGDRLKPIIPHVTASSPWRPYPWMVSDGSVQAGLSFSRFACSRGCFDGLCGELSKAHAAGTIAVLLVSTSSI